MHEHRTPPLRLASLLAAAAAFAAATAIAACGSSSPSGASSPARSNPPAGKSSSAGTSSNSSPSKLVFSKCMRANGVPNFPDLGSNGIRIEASGQTLSVNGVPVNAPAFETARQKCQRYLPGIHASQAQTTQLKQQGVRFARCMRSHGAPNFPDPRVITGPGGNQEAFLPGVNLQAPAVQAAAKACGGGPKGP